MDLREFMFYNKITQEQLGKQVGATRSYINAIVHGRYKPSMDLAKRLEEATNGKVSLNTILSACKKK